MPDREAIYTVAREWIGKADNDFKNAEHTLKLGQDCPTDTVCFHAQQCVEKYIKALLVLNEINFSKTHDIGLLFSLLPRRFRPKLSAEEKVLLTEYATGARYPGYDPISLSETRRAVALARRVRIAARKVMPEEIT